MKKDKTFKAYNLEPRQIVQIGGLTFVKALIDAGLDPDRWARLFSTPPVGAPDPQK